MKVKDSRPKVILKIGAEVVTDGFRTTIRIAQCTDPQNPGIPMGLWFGRESTFDEVEHEIDLRDLFRAREDLIAHVTERLFRLLSEKLPGKPLFGDKP